MTAMTTLPCDIDELRTLFLFEKLTDEQLDWLCEHGHVELLEPGPVYREGEPGRPASTSCSRATLALSPAGRRATTSRSAAPTSAACTPAPWQAYLGDRVPQTYNNSMRVTAPSRFFVLSADDVRRR